MESFPLPDEVVLKILGYLNLGDLIKCARVCKKLNNICKDDSLRYIWLRYVSSMPVIKTLTVKDHESILNILIANPVKVKEVKWRNPSNCSETSKKQVRTEDHREHKKAALHYMISDNKLVLQVFYLCFNFGNDPHQWTRLAQWESSLH